VDELERLRSKFPRKDKTGATKPIAPEPYHRHDISDAAAAADDKHKIPKVNDGRIEADEMAAYVMSYLDFITIRESKDNDVLVYSPTLGIYTPDGDKAIAMRSESFLLSMGLGSTVTNHYIKETIGHVVRQTFISKSELDANMDIIVCRNGVIKLSTGELLPFDKKYKATIAIPVAYDTNAVCPQIDKFISEVVEAADIDILYEMPAWCLIRNSEIQRLVLLLGNGQDGKSKYIGLLKSFLGARNCSSYTLQQLTNNQFAASGLDGKLANLVADLPSKALYDIGILKTMTGGDNLQVEKKFGHSFEMFNRAKLICVANQPPEIPEDTRAFWRRLIIVEFPFMFEGDKRDPYILDKITTPQELSGLLNKAISLIPKLKAKSDLTYNKTIDDTREKYNLRSDPARSFIEECIQADEWPTIIKKEVVYQHFVNYCKKNGLAPVGKKKLGRIIKSEKYSEDRDCWRGMSLKVINSDSA
jgi:putative DNA primase/helicase